MAKAATPCTFSRPTPGSQLTAATAACRGAWRFARAAALTRSTTRSAALPTACDAGLGRQLMQLEPSWSGPAWLAAVLPMCAWCLRPLHGRAHSFGRLAAQPPGVMTRPLAACSTNHQQQYAHANAVHKGWGLGRGCVCLPREGRRQGNGARWRPRPPPPWRQAPSANPLPLRVHTSSLIPLDPSPGPVASPARSQQR